MMVLGLTGGIGMGKSTAAAVFRRARFPVFDADAEVHRMYAKRGRAVRPIEAAFPGVVIGGQVDRGRLRAVLGQPSELARLERIVHPLVHRAQNEFVARARRHRARAVVIDNPLLLEMGDAWRVDFVVVVSAPRAVQMQRVRRRGTMTSAQIAGVIVRQMPDAEKRRRADLVVQTGLSRYHSRRQLIPLIARILA